MLGMSASSYLSVDDPAGPDPLEVTLGHMLEVTPCTGGGGYGGGGRGGAFVAHLILEALYVAPEGEVLLGVFLPVLILVSSCGHWDWGEQGGAGMLKHAKPMGGRLAIAKMACG